VVEAVAAEDVLESLLSYAGLVSMACGVEFMSSVIVEKSIDLGSPEYTTCLS
jgi:hypothetical protein